MPSPIQFAPPPQIQVHDFHRHPRRSNDLLREDRELGWDCDRVGVALTEQLS